MSGILLLLGNTEAIFLGGLAVTSESSILKMSRLKMPRKLAINFMILLILQGIWLQAANCAVKRDDLIPLGEELGFPVYQWKDDSIPTKAIIVAFHGMTFYALAFNDTATHLAARGYPVYAFDFHGFGCWCKNNSKYQDDGKVHFTESTEDGKKLITALHAQYPDNKIFCIGESLGSNLALLAVSQEDLPVDGEILCGLGIKTFIHPTFRWIPDFLSEIFTPNRPFKLEPYIKPNLASDPEVTQQYLNDPDIVHKLSSVDLVKALLTNKKSIKSVELVPSSVSFLIISGEHDRIFKFAPIRDLAYSLGSERATLKVIPGKGHLLLELRPMQTDLADTIDTWLDKQVGIQEMRAQDKDKQFDNEEAKKLKEPSPRML